MLPWSYPLRQGSAIKQFSVTRLDHRWEQFPVCLFENVNFLPPCSYLFKTIYISRFGQTISHPPTSPILHFSLQLYSSSKWNSPTKKQQLLWLTANQKNIMCILLCSLDPTFVNPCEAKAIGSNKQSWTTSKLDVFRVFCFKN